MGRRRVKNELQDYLDYVKENQEHQYSRGYWAGKIRRFYPEREGDILEGLGGCFWIINGVVIVIVSVGYLLWHLDSWNPADGRDWSYLGWTILIIFLGLAMIWGGIERKRMKK